jgi:hypothetical protein
VNVAQGLGAIRSNTGIHVQEPMTQSGHSLSRSGARSIQGQGGTPAYLHLFRHEQATEHRDGFLSRGVKAKKSLRSIETHIRVNVFKRE